MRAPQVLPDCPQGWWYRDERGKGTWCGPFEDSDSATKTAKALAPERAEFVKVVLLQVVGEHRVMLWKPCDCVQGFDKDGYVCTICEGTGRKINAD